MSTSGGNLLEHRIERLVQQFQAGDFGVVQVHDHAGALGLLDPRLAQGVLQPSGRRGLLRLTLAGDVVDVAFAAPHRRKLASVRGAAKAPADAIGRSGGKPPPL